MVGSMFLSIIPTHWKKRRIRKCAVVVRLCTQLNVCSGWMVGIVGVSISSDMYIKYILISNKFCGSFMS